MIMGLTSIFLVCGFIGYVNSRPQGSIAVRHQFTGVATFNDYATQTNTVCGPKKPSNLMYFGAAAGDISPNISGGQCSGSIDPSLCVNGQYPASNYMGPSCPKTNCGVCYTVTNMGPYGSVSSSPGASIVVQIIDSCPSTSAFNYCKTGVPANERCGDGSKNSLDIDINAYTALTGAPWNNSPNLNIMIQPVAC